jgi:hypothetical protein
MRNPSDRTGKLLGRESSADGVQERRENPRKLDSRASSRDLMAISRTSTTSPPHGRWRALRMARQRKTRIETTERQIGAIVPPQLKQRSYTASRPYRIFRQRATFRGTQRLRRLRRLRRIGGASTGLALCLTVGPVHVTTVWEHRCDCPLPHIPWYRLPPLGPLHTLDSAGPTTAGPRKPRRVPGRFLRASTSGRRR